MNNWGGKGRRGEKEVKEDISGFERRRSKKGEEIKRGEEGMDGEEGREMGGETTNKGMEKKV